MKSGLCNFKEQRAMHHWQLQVRNFEEARNSVGSKTQVRIILAFQKTTVFSSLDAPLHVHIRLPGATSYGKPETPFTLKNLMSQFCRGHFEAGRERERRPDHGCTGYLDVHQLSPPSLAFPRMVFQMVDDCIPKRAVMATPDYEERPRRLRLL
jgi:hypothetical protein